MDQTGERAATLPALAVERVFPGDGEMARLMRATDWSQTPLGPVEMWSPSLRMMVRFLLANRFPLLLWWGPDFLQLYNDAYRPVLGTKHPQYLGRSVRECWSEIIDVIGPLIETPFNGGPATWMEDIFLEINRHGFVEETHFTIAYSPVPDETAPNGIGGVLATVHEISEQVVGERRVALLRDLGARSAEAKTAEEACRITAETLAQYPKDIPFALLYLIDPDGTHARLAAAAGAAPGAPFSPAVIALGTEPGAGAGDGQDWPLTEVVRAETMRVVDDLAARYDAVPPGPWADPPHTTVVVPIRSNLAHQLAGLMVAGVSARLRFDDSYAGFLDLVSSQIATAIANARAYEEERKRAEALAEIDRAKTIFFSNVSHEFRTPLTLMLGPLADLLAGQNGTDALAPAARDQVELIQRNGLRLLKLVNTLLDFARIEAGRARAAYAPADLAALTADLASAFRSLVEKAGLALIVDCPPLPEGAGPVYVDHDMWEKIVLNLLSNAFKFTFDGAITVTLRSTDDGSGAELTVRDTGVGIPPAELPHIFERFHRVEGVRARTHEGSGIGLALVQELVHLHGGMIWAVSAEGVGTTFFVRLPAGTAHLPPARVQPDQPDQTRSTLASTALGATAYVEEAGRWLPDSVLDDVPDRVAPSLALGDALEHAAPAPGLSGNAPLARIVLADDNADMREYLRRLLGARYAVEAVANGTDALAAIRRDPHALPDLVLSDVMMPEVDGFGLLRELRADPRTATLPIMLLSARAGEEATIEGLAAGADDYLVKPFSAREVLSRVSARLEIARTRAESERRTREALDALLQMAETLVRTDADLEDAGGERLLAPTASPVGQRIVELTRRVVNCEVAAIVLLDRDTLRLAPVAVVGLAPEIERQWWYDVPRTTLNEFYRMDVVERLRAGETVLVDLEAQPLLNAASYGVRRVLIVPMRIGERIIGLFPIEHPHRETPYRTEEVALVEAVARLAALILERERLLREQAEAQTRELALEEANRRMDEFLGIASHELRTPLTSVTANVQLAERQLRALSSTNAYGKGAPEGRNDDARRAHTLLERSARQLTRLDRLVGDLLDSSRIQAGKLELRAEPCDLAVIVREAVQEQRAAWRERSITLDLPRRAAAPLHADGDRIGQVVTNYLTNALKYSAEDAPVEVRLRVRGETARVDVRDHGVGLSAEQQARLFERFYRVPGIEQQSGSGVGLGLGLSICRTIVERHGGAVGVESMSGEGSTFWFTLPLGSGEGADGRV